MKRTASTLFLLVVLAAAVMAFPPVVATAPTQHSITAPWTYTQGTDPAVGFNVYRGTTAGGPYGLINPVPVGGTATPLPLTTTSFTDTTGIGGVKYFYVVTAIDASGFESAYSNEMSGTFLANPAAPVGGTLVIK